MNKAEMVAELAAKTGISKIQAHHAITAIFDPAEGILSEAIASGEKVMLPGFGVWAVRTTKPRKGVSPVDQKPIQIAAKKVVSFKAGKTLKERLAPLDA